MSSWPDTSRPNPTETSFAGQSLTASTPSQAVLGGGNSSNGSPSNNNSNNNHLNSRDSSARNNNNLSSGANAVSSNTYAAQIQQRPRPQPYLPGSQPQQHQHQQHQSQQPNAGQSTLPQQHQQHQQHQPYHVSSGLPQSLSATTASSTHPPGQPSSMSYQFLSESSQSGPFASYPGVAAHSYPGDPSQPSYYDIRSSPRSYVPIAPDPAGVQRMHSLRGISDYSSGGPSAMEDSHVARQHSTSSTYRESPTPPMLRDEDRLLLQLKDEESLPWRDIVSRMSSETGQNFQIPALQMRYRRLKDRMRVWTPQDIEALRKAHEYWETKKFEIIANKMQDYGVEEKWTPRACQRKWNEMNPGGDDVANASRRSTIMSSGSPQAPYSFHLEPAPYSSAPPPPPPQSQGGYW